MTLFTCLRTSSALQPGGSWGEPPVRIGAFRKEGMGHLAGCGLDTDRLPRPGPRCRAGKHTNDGPSPPPRGCRGVSRADRGGACRRDRVCVRPLTVPVSARRHRGRRPAARRHRTRSRALRSSGGDGGDPSDDGGPSPNAGDGGDDPSPNAGGDGPSPRAGDDGDGPSDGGGGGPSTARAAGSRARPAPPSRRLRRAATPARWRTGWVQPGARPGRRARPAEVVIVWS